MDQHNTEWTPGTKKCDLNVKENGRVERMDVVSASSGLYG